MVRWLLVLCTLLALALRLHGLTDEPLWYDEILTFFRADAASPLGVLRNQLRDCQTPLHDLLTWFLVRACGDGEIVARLPAALFGAALVPAAWALARETFGAGAAAVAGALAAVAPVLVAYGQEGRPYALFALLSALLLLAATRLARSGGERGHKLLAWCAPLILVTHYYGTLVLAAVLVHLAWNLGALRRRLGRLVVALLPALAAALVGSPVALWQLSGPSGAIVYQRPGARTLLAALDGWTLEGAAAAAGELDRCTFVQLGLAAAGALLLLARRRGGDGTAAIDGAVSLAGSGGDERVLRHASRALLAAGTAVLLLAAAWPQERVAALAARLFRDGRELDEAGRSFVGGLRLLAVAEGAALLALGGAVRALPLLVRRLPPRRPADPLLPLAILLPLAAIVTLDALGVVTFLARHTIYAAGPLAVLAGGAIAGPGRRPTTALLLLGILAAGSARGMRSTPPIRGHPDYRSAGALVMSRADLAPLAHPDWTARCVEYYARRPWRSVAGVDDEAQARSFAAGHPRFLMLTAYEGFVDPRRVRRALEETHRATALESPRGVRCELWERR